MDAQTNSAELANQYSWYHTFDLPDGTVTKGLFDHRNIVDKLLLPERLDGLRCLDAASADGFFAFELKRRGAREVVSLDGESNAARDWQGPPNQNPGTFDMSELRKRFELVRDATGLEVQRVQMNLYDINPETLGTFDLVFMGNVLLHLRNPQAALHAIWSVTEGEFISFESVSYLETLMHPRSAVARLWDGPTESRWWLHNVVGHKALLKASGFEVLESDSLIYQPYGPGQPSWWQRKPRGIGYKAGWLMHGWRGIPSAVCRTRPVGKK